MKIDLSLRSETWLYGLLGAAVLAVFAIDLSVPLGTAVWVIYLVPTVLAYLAARPQVPLVVAAAVTVLVIAGFLVPHAGIDPDVARLNRAMGVATVWVLALTGYFFIRNKLAVRAQDWLQAGHVQLSRHIAGELELPDLGREVVTFLAKYLGAQAGAFYARNGDRFTRIGTFGVPVDAKVPVEFTAGDGMLAQVVSDDQITVISSVPEGYLYFGSGLGRGKPAGLLLAPTHADDAVNGVIELGFAGAPPAGHIELIGRVADAIGIAIRSAQYRTRL
ncbi:MAG TPA: GAF domain-containing protein, partial [Rhodopila sp.]|nr:GAF domain-containing protein [Rhodopila sp.]